MALYVVSDLHIRGAEDPLYAALLALLRTKARPGDLVVMAGDVFDLLVGNKSVFRERYGAFLAALAEAGARGVRMHYIEGNHDFLVEGVFRGIPNLELHASDCAAEMNGKRFYFAHGDLVDTTDYGYRALRGFFRSPAMKALVWLAPGRWLDGFGKASSRASSRKSPRLPAELPIERRERLRKAYRSFAAEKIARDGYDFVVMGHCHDLDEMEFQVGDRRGQYINVGYPRVHGSLLSWEPGDERIRREALPS